MIETYFALSFPLLDVFNVTSATDIHILSGLDQHVIRWDNIGDGRVSRILPVDPDSYRYIVRRLAK